MATHFPQDKQMAVLDGTSYVLACASDELREYLMGRFHATQSPSLRWLGEIGALIAKYVQSEDKTKDAEILRQLEQLAAKHLK
jgi:hypothetical protein